MRGAVARAMKCVPPDYARAAPDINGLVHEGSQTGIIVLVNLEAACPPVPRGLGSVPPGVVLLNGVVPENQAAPHINVHGRVAPGAVPDKSAVLHKQRVNASKVGGRFPASVPVGAASAPV
jgi:hypothetical protein